MGSNLTNWPRQTNGGWKETTEKGKRELIKTIEAAAVWLKRNSQTHLKGDNHFARYLATVNCKLPLSSRCEMVLPRSRQYGAISPNVPHSHWFTLMAAFPSFLSPASSSSAWAVLRWANCLSRRLSLSICPLLIPLMKDLVTDRTKGCGEWSEGKKGDSLRQLRVLPEDLTH